MTMPIGSTEEPTAEFVMPEAVAVHVVSSDAKPTRAVGTEFGQWRTYLINNAVGVSATPGATRIAARSPRRHRLLIAVFATVAAQPVIDGTIVGSRDFINAGITMNPANGLNGGYLPIGTSLRWECQQELWACYPTTNTNPVFVVVCDESYASGS